jgi:hypothetical protein
LRWSTYRPPDGSFTVEMPGTAKVKSERDNIPAVGVADLDVASVPLAGSEEAGWRVVSAELPPDFYFIDPKSNIAPLLQEIRDTEDVQVTGSADAELDDHEAVKFTAVVAGKTLDGFFVPLAQRLYLVFTEGDIPEPDRTKFFESFDLKR